jgi:hypothetical protein
MSLSKHGSFALNPQEKRIKTFNKIVCVKNPLNGFPYLTCEQTPQRCQSSPYKPNQMTE